MSAVSSIREALPITGRTILEITTDDWDEVKEKYPHIKDRQSRIYLHLDDGSTVSFVIGEGDKAFSYDGFNDKHPFMEEEDGEWTCCGHKGSEHGPDGCNHPGCRCDPS